MLRQKNIIILSLVFSVLLCWFSEKEILSEDMVIHIPFIKRTQNPQLYPDDYIFEFANPQSQFTLYYPLLAAGTGENNQLLVLKSAYFLTTFFLITAVLSLIHKLSLNIYTGVLFLILLAFRFQVGGAAVQIFETTLLPRFLSLTFGLWSVFFLWDRRYFLSTFLVLIGGFVHPLTMFYYLLCFTGYCLFQSQLKTKIIFLGSLIIIITLTTLFVSPMNPDWLQIVKVRSSYAFMTLWTIRAWFNLGILLFPGIVFCCLRRSNSFLQKIFVRIFATALIISFVHVAFTSMWPLSTMVSLQLGRIWLFPVWISLLLLAKILTIEVQSRSGRILLAGILLVFVIAGEVFLRQKDMSRDSWVTVEKWAKSSTDQTCTFLVPFYSKGFRVISERSIVGEYKDGALAFYSNEFAKEWRERTRVFSAWESLSTEELIVFQNQYEFDYLVEKAPNTRNLPLVYTNSDFVVYDVRQNKSCL